jgi:hypothetical protein
MASTRARGLAAFVLLMLVSSRAFADETDNFTCRSRPLRDAMPLADALVNAEIAAAVARANARGPVCDAGCLARALQDGVGANVRQRLTGIPHARLARLIERHPDVDRCHLDFRTSIYGARPYHRPWLLPFLGRVIWLADSIRLADRIVGLDKINHFLREGLAHWRLVDDAGVDLPTVMARELGSEWRRWSLTERGLKGASLTGVLAYADLAASYAGYRFWRDLLAADQPDAFVVRDENTQRFVTRRRFTFAEYVTDAWDEAVNCSAMRPRLAREVTAALSRRGVTCPIADCASLAALPDARLYVNPGCLAQAEARVTHPRSSGTDRLAVRSSPGAATASNSR